MKPLYIRFWMGMGREVWDNLAMLHGRMTPASPKWYPDLGWRSWHGWAIVHPWTAAECWRGLRRLVDDQGRPVVM